MPVTTEQRNEIKKIIEETPLTQRQKDELKLSYVTREECNGTTAEITKLLSRDFARFGVRLNCGVNASNITYVLTGAASSVTNASQTVAKV